MAKVINVMLLILGFNLLGITLSQSIFDQRRRNIGRRILFPSRSTPDGSTPSLTTATTAVPTSSTASVADQRPEASDQDDSQDSSKDVRILTPPRFRQSAEQEFDSRKPANPKDEKRKDNRTTQGKSKRVRKILRIPKTRAKTDSVPIKPVIKKLRLSQSNVETIERVQSADASKPAKSLSRILPKISKSKNNDKIVVVKSIERQTELSSLGINPSEDGEALISGSRNRLETRIGKATNKKLKLSKSVKDGVRRIVLLGLAKPDLSPSQTTARPITTTARPITTTTRPITTTARPITTTTRPITTTLRTITEYIKASTGPPQYKPTLSRAKFKSTPNSSPVTDSVKSRINQRKSESSSAKPLRRVVLLSSPLSVGPKSEVRKVRLQTNIINQDVKVEADSYKQPSTEQPITTTVKRLKVTATTELPITSKATPLKTSSLPPVVSRAQHSTTTVIRTDTSLYPSTTTVRPDTSTLGLKTLGLNPEEIKPKLTLTSKARIQTKFDAQRGSIDIKRKQVSSQQRDVNSDLPTKKPGKKRHQDSSQQRDANSGLPKKKSDKKRKQGSSQQRYVNSDLPKKRPSRVNVASTPEPTKAEARKPSSPRKATFFDRKALKKKLKTVVLSVIKDKDDLTVEEKVKLLRKKLVAEVPVSVREHLLGSENEFRNDAKRLFLHDSGSQQANQPVPDSKPARPKQVPDAVLSNSEHSQNIPRVKPTSQVEQKIEGQNQQIKDSKQKFIKQADKKEKSEVEGRKLSSKIKFSQKARNKFLSERAKNRKPGSSRQNIEPKIEKAAEEEMETDIEIMIDHLVDDTDDKDDADGNEDGEKNELKRTVSESIVKILRRKNLPPVRKQPKDPRERLDKSKGGDVKQDSTPSPSVPTQRPKLRKSFFGASRRKEGPRYNPTRGRFSQQPPVQEAAGSLSVQQNPGIHFTNFDYDDAGNLILLNGEGLPVGRAPSGSFFETRNSLPASLDSVHVTPVFISDKSAMNDPGLKEHVLKEHSDHVDRHLQRLQGPFFHKSRSSLQYSEGLRLHQEAVNKILELQKTAARG